MARRHIRLLTVPKILPQAYSPVVSTRDDSVDGTQYSTSNDVINYYGSALPNFYVLGVYGQRAGAISSTTNAITSVTMFGGLYGGIYPAVPLLPPTLHTFGRLLQFWGAFIKNDDGSITATAIFSNTQTRCTLHGAMIYDAETVKPYSSAGVQGAVGSGDLSASVQAPAGSAVLAMATQNANAAFTWGGGVTEQNPTTAADSSSSIANGAVPTAGPLTITANVPGTPNATMMQVVVFR